MKREEVQKQIPGITKEQLDWLMNENGNDVTREKNTAKQLQEQLDNVQGQLKTAQDSLAAFDGVDVADLKGQIKQLTDDLAAQADGFAFDSALDAAIRDAGGRSVRAVRGMLDLDALKASRDRTADIAAALEALAKENAWAFAAPQGDTGATVSTGGEHGSGGTAEPDGVEAAFAALNPGLALQ